MTDKAREEAALVLQEAQSYFERETNKVRGVLVLFLTGEDDHAAVINESLKTEDLLEGLAAFQYQLRTRRRTARGRLKT